MVQIGHIELFVADPVASREFYERVLGFEVLAEQGEGRFIWIRLGNAEILLRQGNPPQPASEYGASPGAIVLYTDDLAAALAELQSRGLRIRGEDGGPDCPTFTDPDGHWFQLVSPPG